MESNLEVELLDHVVTLCLTFWEANCLPKCTISHSHQQGMRVPVSAHPCHHVIACLFYSSHPRGCEVDLIVVVIWSSLMAWPSPHVLLKNSYDGFFKLWCCCCFFLSVLHLPSSCYDQCFIIKTWNFGYYIMMLWGPESLDTALIEKGRGRTQPCYYTDRLALKSRFPAWLPVNGRRSVCSHHHWGRGKPWPLLASSDTPSREAMRPVTLRLGQRSGLLT